MANHSFFLFCLLAISSSVSVVHGDFLSSVGDTFKGAVNSLCSTLFGSIAGIGTCQVDFINTLTTPQRPIFDSDDKANKDFEEIRGNIKSCCALATFQTCVYNYIKEKCGSEAEYQSRKLVHDAVGKSDDHCTGTEWYYQAESPLCWPEPVQYIAVIVLGIIFLLSCCCCVVRICRK